MHVENGSRIYRAGSILPTGQYRQILPIRDKRYAVSAVRELEARGLSRFDHRETCLTKVGHAGLYRRADIHIR